LDACQQPHQQQPQNQQQQASPKGFPNGQEAFLPGSLETPCGDNPKQGQLAPRTRSYSHQQKDPDAGPPHPQQHRKESSTGLEGKVAEIGSRLAAVEAQLLEMSKMKVTMSACCSMPSCSSANCSVCCPLPSCSRANHKSPCLAAIAPLFAHIEITHSML